MRVHAHSAFISQRVHREFNIDYARHWMHSVATCLVRVFRITHFPEDSSSRPKQTKKKSTETKPRHGDGALRPAVIVAAVVVATEATEWIASRVE